MTLAKRVYDYQGEQFEVTQTSPYAATVSIRCDECGHEDYIVGTLELKAVWLIGKRESDEGAHGPINTFSLAVDWCCYFLLMECKGITYVDEFFAGGAHTSRGAPDASLPLSSDEVSGTTLGRRVYEHGDREFVVIRTSPESVTVNLNCKVHYHNGMKLEMSAGAMREWVISRAGDLLRQDDTFGGDELGAAIEYCCKSLVRECQDSVQIDKFFNECARNLQEDTDACVTSAAGERGSTTLDNRLYEHQERKFEVNRTSLDSATVDLKCDKHEHEHIIVGRMEGESGWLVGQGANPFGPIGTIEAAVEHCANLLVEACEAAKQIEDFFSEGEPTLKERLDALAAFLPNFESPNFEFGNMEAPAGKMPYYTLSPLASRFLKTCYEMGWVKSFDWSEWMRSSEATQLRDDPSALANATWEQLSRLLTVVIRQDRFVEGALGSAFESGLLGRVVLRASALAKDALDTQPQESSMSE